MYTNALALLLLTAAVLYGCGGASNVQSQSRGPGAQELRAYDAERQYVVRTAQSMIGKPYRYGGNTPGRGFDCSGLVEYSHRVAGIHVPRTTAQQQSAARPVALRDLQPGDLLFFRIEGKTGHVGIYLGDGRFVHAPSGGKSVGVASLDHVYWKPRLIGAGHYY
ncbi:MAG TPA: NlpC/P60 family protein [Thioalkalivibrio sp.]|nr:NlpC/P60 family protein [Thioalkalivibrio sp.]